MKPLKRSFFSTWLMNVIHVPSEIRNEQSASVYQRVRLQADVKPAIDRDADFRPSGKYLSGSREDCGVSRYLLGSTEWKRPGFAETDF
jgi:hypothetical protein